MKTLEELKQEMDLAYADAVAATVVAADAADTADAADAAYAAAAASYAAYVIAAANANDAAAYLNS